MTYKTLPLLSLLTVAGCSTTSLQPMNTTALPARTPIATDGGYQLELEPDGALVYRPASGDIEAALGVTLVERPDGLTVSGQLDAQTGLRVGDVIRRVRPCNPIAVDHGAYEARLQEERRVYEARRAFGEDVPVEGPLERAADVAPLDTSSLANYGSQVQTADDLRGYSLSWTGLDVLVERDGEPVALRQVVGEPQPLPLRHWYPDWTRKQGFLGVRVSTLPAHLRPKRAHGDDDLLVTWVAEQSPLAIRGLRPLALVSMRGDDVDSLTRRPAAVRLPGRRGHIDIDFYAPGEPTDLTVAWVVADVESDPVRTTWSLAAGYLFQYASAYAYNARTDDYVQSWAWSIGGSAITSASVWTSERSRESKLGLGLSTDRLKAEVPTGSLSSSPFAFDWYDVGGQD